MSRIYGLTEKAIEEQMNWEEAIECGEIETVEEFETIEEALEAYANYDEDLYGVE